NPRIDFLPGTLDLIVLRTLTAMGPQHAYSLAARVQQIAGDPVRRNQGSLYPALVRLEQQGWIKGTWRRTENKREARYYAVTAAGQKALAQETVRWRRLAGIIEKLLWEDS